MPITLSRRQLVAGSAKAFPIAALGSGVLAGCNLGTEAEASPGFLDTVADLVIPGARTAQVGAYMQKAFEHGLFGSHPRSAVALEAYFGRKLRHTFMSASLDDQTRTIRELDSIAFAKTSTQQPSLSDATVVQDKAIAMQLWRPAKSAIIVGFYMSETGASKELRYELVPGRYDPDIPYKPGDTYLSNNWNANAA